MNRHWPDIAKQWSQVGPPLRPSAEDLAIVVDAVKHFPRPRVLVLGVTQELYRLPWPAGTSILAVDHTQAMIQALWPGPRDTAINAEWTDMPLPSGSRDVVLCDGGLALLNYPRDQKRMVSEIARVLSPGGLCIFRFYVPPAVRESPRVVLDDLVAGRIPNLNELKIRLCMAMQDDAAAGVRLGDVWNAVRNAVRHAAADFQQLAGNIGWPIEHLVAINTYRDSDVRYHFIGLEGIRDIFCQSPGGLEIDSIRLPHYAMADRFPTVIFRRAE